MKLSDEQVALVLDRAIAGIDPVIDVLAERDPFNIKEHTFHPKSPDEDTADQRKHLVASPANRAAWPGTEQWEHRTVDQRAEWWETRIGSVNSIAVAAPGMFGFWTRFLPVATLLGFANQAMVLVAMAREYGVDDRNSQIELLAAVLCDREITATAATRSLTRPLPSDRRERNLALIRAVWSIAQILSGLTDQLAQRPQPPRVLRWIGAIPVVGGPVNYLGERIALHHATAAARRWITEHPQAIEPAHRG